MDYHLTLEDQFSVLEKLKIPQSYQSDLQSRLYAEYDRWGHELVNEKIQDYVEKIQTLEEAEFELSSCTDWVVTKTKNVEMDVDKALMRIRSQLNQYRAKLSQTVGYSGSYGRSSGVSKVVRC